MAPQARLTFTPSSSLAPAHQAAPALLSSSAQHEKPLPKLPPRVDCTGPFSLLRGGGVKVGTLEVAIQPGTTVNRASPGEYGAESSGELRWEGATEADVEAIHRALLFLPPSHALPRAPAHPSHAPPPAHLHTYRNSLLLYSPSQHSIISVLPLPSSSAPHTHPSAPSPTHHPSPAAFAAYIDHVVEGISPDPTREVLERERREGRRRREEAARMEEEGWEDGWEEEGEPVLGFLVLPKVEARPEAGGVGERERKAHRKSFERLDLEMDLAPDIAAHTPPMKHSPAVQRLRPTSMLSVSSFATFGRSGSGAFERTRAN
uniref:FGENESH: predicted gene_11.73 protein n=1 Tax=Rhodotorula toruloides TaxID=5286 RepID=A0A0K3CR87_RHOTO